MEARFSIGEVAKLNNISVQALRHYDKIGLLKPSYINDETGYRYYSAQDFVLIDAIKQCKALGLSLDEVKEVMANYTSFESILTMMNKQKEMVNEKIKELETIKTNIEFLEHRIQETLSEGINEIIIKYHDERTYLKYDNIKRYTEEFEISLSQTLAHVEQQFQSFNKELAFTTSYEHAMTKQDLVYNSMLMSFSKNVSFVDTNQMIIPAGHYLTFSFDDNYKDTKKYYGELIDYINKHSLEVVGDFYEIYIMTRIDATGKERSLGKIQILLKDNK